MSFPLILFAQHQEKLTDRPPINDLAFVVVLDPADHLYYFLQVDVVDLLLEHHQVQLNKLDHFSCQVNICQCHRCNDRVYVQFDVVSNGLAKRLQGFFFGEMQVVSINLGCTIFLRKNVLDLVQLLVVFGHFGSSLHHHVGVFFRAEDLSQVSTQGSNFGLFASGILEVLRELNNFGIGSVGNEVI